jgi:magnesium transporter
MATRTRSLTPRPERPRATPSLGASPGTLRAPEGAQAPSARVLSYTKDKVTEHELGDPAEIGALVTRDAVTWIHVVGLGDAAWVAALGAALGIDVLALEDVLNVGQRPKLEVWKSHAFLVSRLAEAGDVLRLQQVSLFFGERWVLTFLERPADSFEPVRERIDGRGPRIRDNGADYLAYALVDALVDSYFPLEELYRSRLETLEDEVGLGRARQAVERVYAIKRDLRALRRVVAPTTEAVHDLLDPELVLMREGTRMFVRDCYDHSLRLVEALDAGRELGSDLIDLHISHQGQRLNEIMKVLTIFAALFIPLTFIAGIYGMNFDPLASRWNMPELGWAYGYPAALATMAAVAVALMIYFVRKGWIGREG